MEVFSEMWFAFFDPCKAEVPQLNLTQCQLKTDQSIKEKNNFYSRKNSTTYILFYSDLYTIISV